MTDPAEAPLREVTLGEVVEALPYPMNEVLTALYWERADYGVIMRRLGLKHYSDVLRLKRRGLALLKVAIEQYGGPHGDALSLEDA